MEMFNKYALDESGTNPSNLVIGEEHIITDENHNGILLPKYGTYFKRSLRVFRDGVELTAGFSAAQLNSDAAELTGLPCHAVVLLEDPSPATYTLTYQVVGGVYAYTSDVLKEVVESFSTDYALVNFDELVGLPAQFTPTSHLHIFKDITNTDDLVAALYAMCDAILHGRALETTYYQNELNLKLDAEDYTAEDVLSKLMSVMGDGSMLDAGLLGGVDKDHFIRNDQSILLPALRVLLNGNLQLGGSLVGGAKGSAIDVYNHLALTTSSIGFQEDEDNVFLLMPKGGLYAPDLNRDDDTVGLFKVLLPVGKQNIDISMTVDIFNSNSQGAMSLYIAGTYLVGENKWDTTTLSSSTIEDMQVSFGYDTAASKLAIYIGKTGSLWRRPKVRIKDVSIHKDNALLTTWRDGWSVGLSTSDPTEVTSLAEVESKSSGSSVDKLSTLTTYDLVTDFFTKKPEVEVLEFPKWAKENAGTLTVSDTHLTVEFGSAGYQAYTEIEVIRGYTYTIAYSVLTNTGGGGGIKVVDEEDNVVFTITTTTTGAQSLTFVAPSSGTYSLHAFFEEVYVNQTLYLTIPTITREAIENLEYTIYARSFQVENDGLSGTFQYEDNKSRSSADGMYVVDPTVAVGVQGTGVGNGCWVLQMGLVANKIDEYLGDIYDSLD